MIDNTAPLESSGDAENRKAALRHLLEAGFALVSVMADAVVCVSPTGAREVYAWDAAGVYRASVVAEVRTQDRMRALADLVGR